jgi:hypothetical protein
MRQIDPKMVSKGPIVSIFKPMMSTVTEGHFGPTPPAVMCQKHGVNQIPSKTTWENMSKIINHMKTRVYQDDS